jgi:hypothetical protein
VVLVILLTIFPFDLFFSEHGSGMDRALIWMHYNRMAWLWRSSHLISFLKSYWTAVEAFCF